MACELCGRGSCTRSFHSIKDQEAFDNKTGKYAPPCEECESLKHALAAKEREANEREIFYADVLNEAERTRVALRDQLAAQSASLAQVQARVKELGG